MRKLFPLLTVLFLFFTVQGQTMTMYTANLQHGEGTDTVFDFGRQVSAISDAEIVSVQERTTGETGWNSPLSSFNFSEAVYRENSSLGDGNAIWVKNTVTVNSTNSTRLSTGFTGTGGVDVDKSAVMIDATFGGKRFQVYGAHLCWSACSDSQRISQLNALLSWVDSTANLSFDIIILLDANFPPTLTTHYNLFTTNYIDLWQDGINKSIATAWSQDRDSNGSADMPATMSAVTHDTRLIDYGWQRKNPINLTISSVSIPDLRAVCPHNLVANGGLPACTPEVQQLWDVTGDFGVRPTDHNIMKFVFTLASIRKCRFHTNPSCA